MYADNVSDEKFNPIITELFIGGRKINISLAFITQSYFGAPENIGPKLFCYETCKQKRTSTSSI